MCKLLTKPPAVPLGSELRALRTKARLTLADTAEALGTWPIAISRLERGISHDAELARRYQLWLQPRAQAA